MDKVEYILTPEGIANICAASVVQALATLGISSGEINFSQAKRVFGNDFILLYNSGRIRPVSVGSGKGGTIKFRVADILAAKEAERSLARMQLKQLKK